MSRKGWFREKMRHSLAARGIRTKPKTPSVSRSRRPSYRPPPPPPKSLAMSKPPYVRSQLKKDIQDKLKISDKAYETNVSFEICSTERVDAAKVAKEWKDRGHSAYITPDPEYPDFYQVWVKKP